MSQALRHPTRIGATLPSSKGLAKSIAHHTSKLMARYPGAALVEAGAGTGSLSAGLLHHSPLLVEPNAEFAAKLRGSFPDINVTESCITQVLGQADHTIVLVMSIPLLCHPLKREIKASVKDAYTRGKLAGCVTYSYGYRNPYKGLPFVSRQCADFICMNLPPASVWIHE